MTKLPNAWNDYLGQVDVAYSYCLAKKMEQFKSNSALGYRTAGSRAEFETGEMLLAEMRSIGLADAHKDAFTLDTWEFEHARMQFTDEEGGEHYFELGGYQTNFETEGWKSFSIVDAGRCTAAELERLDVRGKLVLADINQRDDWWISYPVYQAHLHGAAAVIAVQENGYGEVDSAALNAQNICGPADAPAFSLSQMDAATLRAHMEEGQLNVLFDATSTVGFDGTSYNIVGSIPGVDPASMILVSAHYDSYFSGFQDDNAAVALMLGIARALVQSGYKPHRTLVFCAMAAEEWGVSNTKYDWSTGAYNQIFRVHPEWVGKVIADINFELPAYAHADRDAIRCVYEYSTFLERFVQELPCVEQIYPGGMSVTSPALTWSDDFSMAIAGVPSIVNDFASGSFMETHYHSQFDNDDAYDEEIYRFHHRLYGLLLLAYDRCLVPPLDFSPRLAALRASIDPERMAACGIDLDLLSRALGKAATAAELCYERVRRLNRRWLELPPESCAAKELYSASRPLERSLLDAFKFCEDAFVRLSWHDDVLFPHEYAQQNLAHLEGALTALAADDTRAALDRLSLVDTNWYARYFDLVVCRHFVDYVLHQPPERLMWGAGRVPGLCELFETVQALEAGRAEPANTAAALRQAAESQQFLLAQAAAREASACGGLAALLEEMLREEGNP